MGGGIIAFVCVCAVVSRLPFFLKTVVSFFSLRQDVNFLSGASGFVIVRAAWTVSVSFVFLGGF